MTTERIASISEVSYSAIWYDYPPILKKYLILMIARSQEDIFFSGFGFVYCTLEILLKVIEGDRFVFHWKLFIDFNAFFCRFFWSLILATERIHFVLLDIQDFISNAVENCCIESYFYTLYDDDYF